MSTQQPDGDGNNQTPSNDLPAVEEQIRGIYAKLPGAGKFVYDRVMEYALKGQYNNALSSYVEDMNHLGRVAGFDNFKKLKAHSNDISQFQLCLLGLLQEASFH